MKLNLSVDDALSTTRAVRKRLDFDKPVETEVLQECLELAVQSPTGSNMQAWQWLVVTDPEKRKALGDIYRKGWELYTTMEGNVATAYKGDDAERIAQQDRVLGLRGVSRRELREGSSNVDPVPPGSPRRAPVVGIGVDVRLDPSRRLELHARSP